MESTARIEKFSVPISTQTVRRVRWPRSQRMPSAVCSRSLRNVIRSAGAAAVSFAAAVPAAPDRRIERISSAESPKEIVSRAKGSACEVENRNAPRGAPRNSVVTNCPPIRRLLAESSEALPATSGTTAWDRFSARVSMELRTNAVTASTVMPTPPVSASRANSPMTEARARSQSHSARHRSTESASVPAKGPTNSHGSREATVTSATRNGSSVSAAAKTANAVIRMPSPSPESVVALHRRRKPPANPPRLAAAGAMVCVATVWPFCRVGSGRVGVGGAGTDRFPCGWRPVAAWGRPPSVAGVRSGRSGRGAGRRVRRAGPRPPRLRTCAAPSGPARRRGRCRYRPPRPARGPGPREPPRSAPR